MPREIRNAFVACAITFVMCAVVYPALVWGVARVAFPRRSEGSLIRGRDGVVIGSELIAQPFATDAYFHPRPSAADYKADAAAGSNLGTRNHDLRTQVAARAEALGATFDNPAPLDLVTASGGGLDPEISPAAAYFQVARVASARKMDEVKLRDLVARRVDRAGAILGAPPRINVLMLNMALDAESAH